MAPLGGFFPKAGAIVDDDNLTRMEKILRRFAPQDDIM
jgi:hypothetical protein